MHIYALKKTDKVQSCAWVGRIKFVKMASTCPQDQSSGNFRNRLNILQNTEDHIQQIYSQ